MKTRILSFSLSIKAGVNTKLDYVEVGRAAHGLAARHGWNTHRYAALPSSQRTHLPMEKLKKSEFWKAVEIRLRPRTQEI